jgi:hypothetical protein
MCVLAGVDHASVMVHLWRTALYRYEIRVLITNDRDVWPILLFCILFSICRKNPLMFESLYGSAWSRRARWRARADPEDRWVQSIGASLLKR